MKRFFTSGGAFILLALVFMVIAVMAEKPAVYIGLGAMWLVVGISMAARNRK